MARVVTPEGGLLPEPYCEQLLFEMTPVGERPLEAAATLGVSSATVERRWRFARKRTLAE